METRPMLPHHQFAPTFSVPQQQISTPLDFGGHGQQQSSSAQQLMDSKQESQSPGCRVGAFQRSGTSPNRLLAGCGQSLDYLPAAALHQLLLPCQSDFEPAKALAGTAAGGYFPSAADSSSALCNGDRRTTGGQLQHPQQHQTVTKCSAAVGGSGVKSGDRKRPYPCSICSSRFGSKMELEEHQNSHTGQKPFQCDVCQSRFNRRSTLWNHKRIHSDAKPFQCTVCHMQFKWKNSLKCHKEMHQRKNELPQAATIPDADSQVLTYATAAKKKMSELTGADPSAITLLPASNAPSRLLTCAGTPRKRAPPKQNQQQKGAKTTASSSKHKQPANAGRPQQHNQQQQLGGAQTAGLLGLHFGGTNGGGSSGDGEKRKQMQQQQKGEEQQQQNGVLGRLGASATDQQQQNNSGGIAAGFDFFRLQQNGLHPSAAAAAVDTGSASAQSAFLHFEPHMLVMDPHQMLHHQQLQQTDLLPCHGSAAANLHLGLEPSLCCNLFQDFQTTAQHCLLEQQPPMRALPAVNFLGFDFNTLANGNPVATDQQQPPSSLQQQLSHSSTSSSSVSSSTPFPLPPSSFVSQQTSSSQPISSSSSSCPFGANGPTSSASALSSCPPSSALNGYQFDPASVRFLAVAAEGIMAGDSSGGQQHDQQGIHHSQQRQQADSVAAAPSSDYGLFCGGIGDYGGGAAGDANGLLSFGGVIRQGQQREGGGGDDPQLRQVHHRQQLFQHNGSHQQFSQLALAGQDPSQFMSALVHHHNTDQPHHHHHHHQHQQQQSQQQRHLLGQMSPLDSLARRQVKLEEPSAAQQQQQEQQHQHQNGVIAMSY